VIKMDNTYIHPLCNKDHTVWCDSVEFEMSSSGISTYNVEGLKFSDSKQFEIFAKLFLDQYPFFEEKTASNKQKTQPKQKKQQKERFVRFYRFVRFRDERGKIDSRKGVTFYIELDYMMNILRFSMATCDGNDNFSKQKGREITKNRFSAGHYQRLSIPKTGIPSDGTVNYIMQKLSGFNSVTHTKMKDFQKILSSTLNRN